MTYPTAAVNTTNLDASGDSPATARSDILDAINKLDQMIAHTTAFAATLLDDANAAAARATLGAAASGANTDITSLAGITSINGGPLAGFRNLLINGGMQVAQRAPVALTTTSSVYGQVDRWLVSVAGTTVSAGANRTANSVSSSGYVLQVANVTTTGTSNVGISQRIEVANALKLRGKVVTFSGRVYQDTGSSQPLDITVFKNSAGSPDVWTAPGIIGSTTQVIPTDTWTTFIFTVGVTGTGLDNGLGVGLNFLTGALSNKNFFFSECQLEIGAAATMFEHNRPYGMELALCQRYFQTAYALIYGYAPTGISIIGHIPFKLTMRVTPTVTYVAGTAFNSASGIGVWYGPTPDACFPEATATTTGNVVQFLTYFATAEL